MKKFFIIVAVALAGVFAISLVSCNGGTNGGGSGDPGDSTDERLFVSQESVSFSPDGGTQTVIVTSELEWEATTDSEWIEITPAGGEFTITVGATNVVRRGTVTVDNGVNSQTVTVEQSALPGAVYGIESVLIPAGTFKMGSPDTEPERLMVEAQHNVTLTEDFYMSKYEITNAQYAAFLNDKNVACEEIVFKWEANRMGAVCTEGENQGKVMLYVSNIGAPAARDWGIHYDDATSKWIPASGYDDNPVVWVTWYGAVEFAKWVGGFLPTEAQWEYACRGGQQESLPFGIGTGKKLTSGMANFYCTRPYDLDLGGPYSEDSATLLNKTASVGSYPYANGYGLYDMHGNVIEWCSDWYGNYDTTDQTDPEVSNPTVDYPKAKVARGGSMDNNGAGNRSAYRYQMDMGLGMHRVGFRVAFAN